MCKAVEEEEDLCRSHEDLGHGEGGEGRRRVGQCGGPGRDALDGHTPSRGPGTVRTRWVGEDYVCSPGRMAVGRHTLGNKHTSVLTVHLEEALCTHCTIQPYLLRTAGAHTERQRAACGCRSTFPESVSGGTLVTLW